MELDQEQLRQKALLLLRRERELFELRMKHEHITLWLALTQALSLLFSDAGASIADIYARLRKTLIEGLRLQRATVFEIDGRTLRPLVPAGSPCTMSPEALALVERESAGFCNGPTEPSAALADTIGLARFIWSRIDVVNSASLILAAGFDRAKAKFQSPFDAADAAHLRNAAQHFQGQIAKARLVRELEQERDALKQANATLAHRDRELHALANELRAANDQLEHRVRDRTQELSHRNRDMRLVLDNVAQALLTIDAAGRLMEERSARADEWFGSYEGSPRFAEYIAKVDAEFADRFAVAHEALVEQILPTEVCVEQLPRRLSAGGRVFHCTYLSLPAPTAVGGLLIVIDDVTEQTRRAQEEAEQTELLALFKGLTSDRDGLLGFVDETSRLIEQLAGGTLDDQTRARHLHTLKGNAGMHGATVIADLCHRAEDQLATGESSDGVAATIRRLENRWAEVRRTLDPVMDERAKDMVEIPARAVELLCRDVGAGAAVDEIVHRLKSFTLEPVALPIARLARYARALAHRIGKGDLCLVVEAADTRVDPQRFRGLWSALVHVIRNAIDHGIEPAAERQLRGKKAQGRVALRAFETSGDLVVEIDDDGRGIDWAKVRQTAAARGMACDSQADLVRAVLSDGFTTRSKVSATSGRGVGMAAVREAVQALGGTVSVVSQENIGTCWQFSFPLVATVSPHRRADLHAHNGVR